MRNSFYDTFYEFECMNSLISGLWHESDFGDDEDAISTAADYEATLFKIKIDEKGNVVEQITLFKPN